MKHANRETVIDKTSFRKEFTRLLPDLWRAKERKIHMVSVEPPCCFELKWAQQSFAESEYRHSAPVNSWLCKHNVNVNASNQIQHQSFFSLAKNSENPWGAGGCITLSNQESSF